MPFFLPHVFIRHKLLILYDLYFCLSAEADPDCAFTYVYLCVEDLCQTGMLLDSAEYMQLTPPD